MEKTTPLKSQETHFTSHYPCQFTNLFYVFVHHPKNCKVEIRENSKGFSMQRRGLREQNALSQVVFHL